MVVFLTLVIGVCLKSSQSKYCVQHFRKNARNGLLLADAKCLL